MIRRFGWCTDIHLDFAGYQAYTEFIGDIKNADLDALFVTGDIGNAANVEEYLHTLIKEIDIPVYFVLGNHDFYGSSIINTRKRISNLCQNTPGLMWVTIKGVMELTPNTVLLGHDSWADGRLGNYHDSPVMLNDYIYIDELSNLDKKERYHQLNRLGDEAANYLSYFLRHALENYDHVICMTHAPPFREACVHDGKIASDDYLPHFSCKAVGDVLYQGMIDNRHVDMLVLCGHTHAATEVDILPNLRVKSGAAEYGKPGMQEIICL